MIYIIFSKKHYSSLPQIFINFQVNNKHIGNRMFRECWDITPKPDTSIDHEKRGIVSSVANCKLVIYLVKMFPVQHTICHNHPALV